MLSLVMLSLVMLSLVMLSLSKHEARSTKHDARTTDHGMVAMHVSRTCRAAG